MSLRDKWTEVLASRTHSFTWVLAEGLSSSASGPVLWASWLSSKHGMAAGFFHPREWKAETTVSFWPNLEVMHSHLYRFLKFSWGDTFTDFGERERNIVFLPLVCSLTGDQTWSLLVYGMILQPTEPPSKGTFAMFWWLHRLIRIHCGKAFDTIWTSAGRIIGGHPVCWLPRHRFICRNARVAYKTWSMVVVIDLHENFQPN